MTMRYTMVEMQSLADAAGQPIDKFVKTAAVLEAHQAAQEQARRSTTEEKEKIAAFVGQLNGEISEDIPVSEILSRAGVRAVQGTRSYANRTLKKALLTHQKAT